MDAIGFNIISSGSRGNSTLVWDNDNLILIDFGISLKRLSARLRELNLSAPSLSLFVSHEHSDHSKGIPYLLRAYNVDVYSKELTLDAISARDGFSIGERVVLGNFRIRAIPVLHDAADPVGYVIMHGKRKITVVSDLGSISKELVDEARGSDILAFESNHDMEMLKNGPYPDMLKRRIMSDHGHLSNEISAEAISRMSRSNTRVILTHLSQENNTPEVARSTVESYLRNRDVPFESIECASQDLGSSLYTIAED